MVKRIGLDDAYKVQTPEDARALYRDWAESYDHDFAQSMDYRLPAVLPSCSPGMLSNGIAPCSMSGQAPG
jgi:hypothetical protein